MNAVDAISRVLESLGAPYALIGARAVGYDAGDWIVEVPLSRLDLRTVSLEFTPRFALEHAGGGGQRWARGRHPRMKTG